MPYLPGVNHRRAVKAFEKCGFRVIRQGKHITMTDGKGIITLPRANPINAFSMAGIINDAGLSIEEFKKVTIGFFIINSLFCSKSWCHLASIGQTLLKD